MRCIIDWDSVTVLRKRDPAKAKVTKSATEINAARRVSLSFCSIQIEESQPLTNQFPPFARLVLPLSLIKKVQLPTLAMLTPIIVVLPKLIVKTMLLLLHVLMFLLVKPSKRVVKIKTLLKRI